MKMKEVLYVLVLKKNLLSISKLDEKVTYLHLLMENFLCGLEGILLMMLW
jgi:hypothetical protein